MDDPALAEPTRCTTAKARRATIQQIMAKPSAYNGKCVAVPGLSDGELLFTSVEGYYLAGPLLGGDPATDPNERERLGLDNRKVMQRIPRGGLRRVIAVGRVQICEEVREMVQANAGPDEFVWISGFCHMANGPYLWLQDVQVGPRSRETRPVGEAMRGKFGNLAIAPSDWPHRAFVVEQVRTYLAALRGGDISTFAALHGEKEIGQDRDSPVRLAFGKHPGFVTLRRSGEEPQIEIFTDKRPGRFSYDPEARSKDDYSATICFCISGECTGRWPISDVDADNREDRPYVCTHVGPWLIGRGARELRFQSERGDYGLPEPRAE